MTSEVVHGTLREDGSGFWFIETDGPRRRYLAPFLRTLIDKRVSISRATTPDGRQSVMVQELVHDAD